MPNGGSDCCMNCRHNPAAREHYRPLNRSDVDYCELRDIQVHRRAYTYCLNNRERIVSHGTEIPVGPAFEAFSGLRRRVYAESPDTEEIRQFFLEWISHVVPNATPAKSRAMDLDSMAIYQLGLFREKRAVPQLERIVHFANTFPEGRHRPDPEKHFLMRLARWALSVMDSPPDNVVGQEWGSVVQIEY